jgi:hypothetical protein
MPSPLTVQRNDSGDPETNQRKQRGQRRTVEEQVTTLQYSRHDKRTP